MVKCKRCGSEIIVKNGIVRDKQRYKCKDCGYNFVVGDCRSKYETEIKKALSIILYSLGKASFGFLGKLFKVSRSTVYKWIKKMAEGIKEPVIQEDIKEIEFDEMWHFIQSKKTRYGLSGRWSVAQGELLPGLSAIVMLKHSHDYIRKSNI